MRANLRERLRHPRNSFRSFELLNCKPATFLRLVRTDCLACREEKCVTKSYAGVRLDRDNSADARHELVRGPGGADGRDHSPRLTSKNAARAPRKSARVPTTHRVAVASAASFACCLVFARCHSATFVRKKLVTRLIRALFIVLQRALGLLGHIVTAGDLGNVESLVRWNCLVGLDRNRGCCGSTSSSAGRSERANW